MGKRILFSAGTLVVALVVLESTLALFGVETLARRQDPSRGFSGLVSVFVRDGDVYRTRELEGQQTFNRQAFRAVKPADGYRLFTLGGSSAYGFPWGAEYAFTAILGDLLSEAHPDRTVEAINASGVSYGMHRVRIVAEEVLEHDADLLVVYSGHNEFIEPGFFRALKERSAARSRSEDLLSRTRLYSALHQALHGEKEDDPRIGARVQRDQSVLYDESEKAEIVAAYRAKLTDLVRAARSRGVDVVLCTVSANLRDWSPQASTSSSRGLAEGAGEPRRDGDTTPALSRLQEEAAAKPDHAETRYRLAQALELAGRWDEARESYALACDLDASPIRRLSAINAAVRSVAAAEGVPLVDIDALFTAASEHGLVGFNLIEDYVHPTLEGHQRIAWELWNSLEHQGWLGSEITPSREAWRKVIARRDPRAAPVSATWLYNTAVVLQKQGQVERAMEKYRQALALDPDYAGARLNLGVLLGQSGQWDAAATEYRRVLQLLPDHVEARSNLAAALKAAGDLDGALAEAQRAVKDDPSARALNNLGAALEAGGDLESAIARYREAAQADAQFAPARVNLGAALQAAGRLDEAATILEEAVRLDPSSAAAHNNLGYVYRAQGQAAKAVARLREAVSLDPDLADARENLGLVLKESGAIAEAIESLQAASALRPENAAYHNNLGSALQAAGRLGDAETQFRRARALAPDQVETEFNLGVVLLMQDRVEDARPHLEAAVRSSPRVRRFMADLASQMAREPDPKSRRRAQVLDEIASGSVR